MPSTNIDHDVIYPQSIAPGDYAEIIACGTDPAGDARVVWYENSQGDVRTQTFGDAAEARLFIKNTETE